MRKILLVMAAALLIATGLVPAGGALGAAPAHAADAVVSGPTVVEPGEDIVVSGTGWLNAAGTEGSVFSVLINARFSGDPDTVYTLRDVADPRDGQITGDKRLHAIVQADADGSWEVRIPYPTAENAHLKDGSAPDWAAGSTQQLRFLSGSLATGDVPRTIAHEFTIAGETGGEDPPAPDPGGDADPAAPDWPHLTVSVTDPDSGGTATAWIESELPAGSGGQLRIAGTGWVTQSGSGGSTIALKLNSGPQSQYTRTGNDIVSHPSATGDDTIWVLFAPENPSGHPSVLPIAEDGSFSASIPAPAGLEAGQYLSALLQSGRFAAGDTLRTVTSDFITVGGVPYTPDEEEARPTCVPTQDHASIDIHPESLVVPAGGQLRIIGAGWCNPTPESGGSVIGLKIDEGSISRLTTEVHQNRTIWTILRANDADGTIDALVDMPDGTEQLPSGSEPAIADGAHTLRLLTGSLAEGDAVRTVQSPEFSIGEYRPNLPPAPVLADIALTDLTRGGLTAVPTASGGFRITIPNADPGDWVFPSAYVADGSVRLVWGSEWLRADEDRRITVGPPDLTGLTGTISIVAQSGEQGRTGEVLGWTPYRLTDPAPAPTPAPSGGARPKPAAATPGSSTPTPVARPMSSAIAAPVAAAPALATAPDHTPALPVRGFTDLTHENVGEIDLLRTGTLLTITVPGEDPGAFVYLTAYRRSGDPVGLGWVALGAEREIVLDISQLEPDSYRFAVQNADDELLGWVAFVAKEAAVAATEETVMRPAVLPTGQAVAKALGIGAEDLWWFGASALLLAGVLAVFLVPRLRRSGNATRSVAGGVVVTVLVALITVTGVSGASPVWAIPPGGASPDTPGTSASVSPRQVAPGGTLNFVVSGFPAGETVHIKIDDGVYCADAAVHGACVVHMQAIDGSGVASGSLQLPGDLAPGAHWLRFLASTPDGKGYTRAGGADFTVVRSGTSGGASGGGSTASGGTAGGGSTGATSGAGGQSGGLFAEGGATPLATGGPGTAGGQGTVAEPLVVRLPSSQTAPNAAAGAAGDDLVAGSADDAAGSTTDAPDGVSGADDDAGFTGTDADAAGNAPAVDAERLTIGGIPVGPLTFGATAILSAALLGFTLGQRRAPRAAPEATAETPTEAPTEAPTEDVVADPLDELFRR